MSPGRQLGQILLESGFVTEEQIAIALKEQEKTGELLGSVLFGLGFLNQRNLFRALSAMQEGSPRSEETLETAQSLTDEIQNLAQQSSNLFQRSADISNKAFDSPNSPLVNLVEKILIDGIRRGATDIHINPDTDNIRVRFRVDGILSHGLFLPVSLLNPIVSRIKIMGQMNIAETRIPQDGSAEFRYGSRSLDLRISSFPVLGGENIVIRILDKSKVLVGIENLGFMEEDVSRIMNSLTLPHGMILVTGPTGSGKTTTLYSFLSMINSVNRNMFTIEDPIEYHLPLARQAQVNVRAGLTFAAGLRSILRQDPDVILVGEIRDGETSELAVRAALTGHLVFSTMHTNDAVSSIARLIDMGVDPFLVASTLDTVIAQRLVRVLCPHCKEALPKDNPAYTLLNIDPQQRTIYGPAGCTRCDNLGYKGRTAIYELLKITTTIRELITSRASIDKIRKEAHGTMFQSMIERGRQKILQGITTFEEVHSVARSVL